MASAGEGSALQVIVLGSGGGPHENNITAFLVRSVAERWSRGSVLAVDAGVHLAAITKILESSSANQFEATLNKKYQADRKQEGLPEDGDPREHEQDSRQSQQKPVLASGPFEGMELHRQSAKGNASYVTSVLVETFLITHPHLDHISGLVVNTAGMTGPHPKRIAGLPPTINALKAHIFNDIIWPNLSDEDHGAGLIKYLRLVEGGPQKLEDEESETSGFVDICKGLQVKTWGVSHGNCAEHPHHRTATGVDNQAPDNAASLQLRMHPKSRCLISDRTSQETLTSEHLGVYDSCAFFIRDMATGKEVLIFGDVEPDSISRLPRNRRVWSEAAPKIFSGNLSGIFIECSYDDTRTDGTLFGHLAPRHLIEEIKVLAAEVTKIRYKERRKRKRAINGYSTYVRRKPPADVDLDGAEAVPSEEDDDELLLSDHSFDPPLSTSSIYSRSTHEEYPLKGIRVIIIHVKERFDDDTNIADTIHRQLLDHEQEAKLGCEFIISTAGQSLYF